MIKGMFEFTVVSASEREKLTCEIYYKNELIAEISQETEQLILEIYPSQKNQWWEIPLCAFQQALEDAKKFLSDGR